jgi:surface protein
MKVGDYFRFVTNLEALVNMEIIPEQDWKITRIYNNKVFFRSISASALAEYSLQKSMFNDSTEQIFPSAVYPYTFSFIPPNPIITNENIKKFVKLYYDEVNAYGIALSTPINDWNVANVNDMSFLFDDLYNFNEPLDKWNVSNVKNMQYMFRGCTSFNQSLDSWNVSNVRNMEYMFEGCTIFNKPLNSWVLNNSQHDYRIPWSTSFTMEGMFEECTSFNQPLDNWNVSKVENMRNMFDGCTSFNQPLDNWNISNVKNIDYMFYGCTSFNQPLNNWKPNVRSMNSVFYDCTSFNQPLDKWKNNGSRVTTDMESMFKGCINFNQPLDKWNVSRVTEMQYMFKGCINFNQPLTSWDINNVDNMRSMFEGCTSFNQPLISWNLDLDNVDTQNMFDGCNIDPENLPRTLLSDLTPPSPPLVPSSQYPLAPSPITSLIRQKSFKHIPNDLQIDNLATMDEENIHEFLKEDENNIVFMFGEHYYPLSKTTIEMQMNNPGNIVYECNGADVQFIRYLPDGSTEPNKDVVNLKTKYLRLNSIALPGDFIPLKSIQKILLDNTEKFDPDNLKITDKIFNLVNTEKILKSVVSYNVLMLRGSYVSASHCQAGSGGVVFDVDTKIIRAYSKRNRKQILSITKRKKGYFSKSKSSKLKDSKLLKKASSRSKSRSRTKSIKSNSNSKKSIKSNII